jgi:hypothetical protein
MTEHTLISLAWWGCPLSAIVLAHGPFRRYALAVLASMSLGTLLWLLLVWIDGGGYLHPDVQIAGALFVVYALVTSLLVGGACASRESSTSLASPPAHWRPRAPYLLRASSP